MVLSIVGIALVLTRLGVAVYAVTALSQSFLNGQVKSKLTHSDTTGSATPCNAEQDVEEKTA